MSLFLQPVKLLRPGMDEHANVSGLGEKRLSVSPGLCKTAPTKLVHIRMIVVDLDRNLSCT
jgi:hypothetical protein